MNNQNNIIIVTGANAGIGRATARGWLGHTASWPAATRRQAKREEIVAQTGNSPSR
jgi:NAD(P)-dependent dehydrogenase (short-subunit alcohol dehydrogenase family)